MPEKLLYTAKNEADIKRFGDIMQAVINNDIHIKGGALDAKDRQDIALWMKDPKLTKKEAGFYLFYDGKLFSSYVKVGPKKHTIIQPVNFLENSSITDTDKVNGLGYLVSQQLATQDQYKAFKNKQALAPLKTRIDDLKKKIKEAEDKIRPDRAELERLEKEYKDKGGK